MTASGIEVDTSRAPRESGSSARDRRPAALPIVIGVTGHHELHEADRLALENSLAGFFAGLRARLDYTPLALLSPLSEGADRLAARVALKNGVRLIVPLPVPGDDYVREFATEASRAEFRDLFASASLSYVIGNADAARPPGAIHQAAYAPDMGAYVARQCQVLVALWDGEDSNDRDHPARVVKLKLEGDFDRFPPGSPLDPPETGPVYHVMATRRGRRPVAWPGEGKWLYPGAPAADADPQTIEKFYRDATKVFHGVSARLDEFNREAVALNHSPSREPEEAAAQLIPPRDRELLTEAADSILDRFALADSLANQYRKRHVRTLKGVIALAFLWTYLYQVHLLGTSSESLDRLIVLSYLVVLFAALTWYLRALRADYLNKFLDYRALAEGLRVRLFWTITGLTEAVEDHYLRRQRSELDWIRSAIRAGRIDDGLEGEAQRFAASLAEDRANRLVLERWADSQVEFMTSRAKSHDATHRKIALLSDGSVVVFLGLAFFKVAVPLFVSGPAPSFGFVNAALTLAVTGAGLLSIYSYKCAFSEQAKQYGVMAQAFQSFQRRLADARAGKGGDFRSLVRDLGKEALAENGDWVLLRRSRPTELPKY